MSLSAKSQDSLLDIAQIGTILKNKRVEHGYSIEDVSRAVNIRADYLNAVEQGNLSKVPAKVYAVGYCKIYAKWLGVEIEQFANANVVEEVEPDLSFLDTYTPPSDKSMFNPRILIIAGLLVLGVIGYSGWRFMHDDETIQTASSHTYQPSDTPLYAKKEQPVTNLASTQPATAPATAPATNTQAAVGTLFPVQKYAHQQLVLMAHEDTWIRILNSHNQLIVRNDLKAGDTFFVPQMSEDIFIAAGNTKAVEVMIAGGANQEDYQFLGTLHEIATHNTLSSNNFQVSLYN